MNNLTLEKICCIQCKDLWQIPERCIGYDASIKLNSPCMIILSRSAKTRKEMQLCKLYNLVNNVHIVLNYFHKKCLDISDLIFGIFLLHSHHTFLCRGSGSYVQGNEWHMNMPCRKIVLSHYVHIISYYTSHDDVVSILLLPDSSGESRK